MMMTCQVLPDGASSVHAGDVDGDGDLDLMSASFEDDTIAWYENDGAAVPSFTRIDAVAWYENEGGQFGLPTHDVAPARTTANGTVAALEIDAIHRGRAGDQDVELATLELLLEDDVGTPLTDAQANALLAELGIYLDDGSGDFDADNDAEVAFVSSFSLDNGVLTVSLADDDSQVQIPLGSSKKYFVGLTTEAESSSAIPDEIRVTHLTESSSTGEDADHDVPIRLEFSSNVASTVIEVNDPPVALDDAASLLEDSGTVSGNVLDGSSGGLDSDEELDPFTAVLELGPSNGTLVGGLAPDGSFTYQPNPSFSGVDSFTYVATDGIESSNVATVTIAVGEVNDAPTFSLSSTHSSLEDGGAQTVAGFATAISAGPDSESGQTLTFNVTGNNNPALFLASPVLAANGTLTYTAEADANGMATIMAQLMDDGGTDNGGVDTSATQSFDLVIGAVNDVPSFMVPASVAVGQDLGPQSFPDFATSLSPGSSNESAQSLTFSITGNTNPDLFSVSPVLASEGTLSFTSAPSAVGIASLTVELMDDGGTANGGVDTSASQEFDIEIRDGELPEVVALEALPGGAIEDCTELDGYATALVVSFTEPMADPAEDSEPEDVTNPANYQLIATGPDKDLGTMACDALEGDDVLVPLTGITYDDVALQATVGFASSLGNGPYRLLVCDSLEDPTGNPLAEDFTTIFRQDVGNLFSGGRFDCDLGSWELMSTTSEEIEYSAEDVDGASISGSVQMTNLTGTSFTVGQCVNSRQANFEVGSSVRVDGAADVLASVTMNCAFYAQADCLGAVLDEASSLEFLGQTAGLWQPSMLTFEAPVASAAVYCGFSIDLLEGGAFDAFLDDLTLSGNLFGDGFESGDVSAWSSSTP